MKLNVRQENIRGILAGVGAVLVMGTSILGFSGCSKEKDESIVLSVPRGSFFDVDDYHSNIDRFLKKPNKDVLEFTCQLELSDFDEKMSDEPIYLAVNREKVFTEKFKFLKGQSVMSKGFFNAYNYFILPDCYSYLKRPNDYFDTTLTVKKFEPLDGYGNYYYFESVNVAKHSVNYIGPDNKTSLSVGDTIVFKGLYGTDFSVEGKEQYKLIGCTQTGAGSSCKNVVSEVSKGINDYSLSLISSEDFESVEFSNRTSLIKYIDTQTK